MKIKVLLLMSLFFISSVVFADAMPAFTVTDGEGEKNTYSISLQILGVMTALTVLPALLLSMTSFTRIIIVLGILRQSMGMPQTPNNQILIGVALFLTFYIMSPVFTEVHNQALVPYMDGKIEIQNALSIAEIPVKKFMIGQTRRTDIWAFKNIGSTHQIDEDEIDFENLSFATLLPAFLTSELKTAFQIGFLLFIPFLVIDLVVASILMAMGMMMLSPLIISLPFKLMLFILVDGWSLVVGTLASSFGGG